jgi:hypothetical protein
MKTVNISPVQVGVKESKGNIISCQWRLLAAKIDNPPFSTMEENVYNVKTFEVTRKTSTDHEQNAMVVSSTGDVIYSMKRPLMIEINILPLQTIGKKKTRITQNGACETRNLS